MNRVFKTAIAAQDMVELATFISCQNPAAADRMLDAIDAKLRVLVLHPELGELRGELCKDVRSSLVSPYVLYYRKLDTDIELLRVLHAARDIDVQFP